MAVVEHEASMVGALARPLGRAHSQFIFGRSEALRKRSNMFYWDKVTGRAHLMIEPSLTVGLMPRLLAFMFICPCLFLPIVAFGQKPPLPADRGMLDPIAVKTDLYPADADATKEIGEALKLAATDHKRVLLVFGANWCYDCHVLDRALRDGAAGKIVSQSFLLVH